MEIVNGYVCHDCTEIDLAKKGVDPAHPKDGPYGRDAKKSDPLHPEKDPELATSGTLGRRLNLYA